MTDWESVPPMSDGARERQERVFALVTVVLGDRVQTGDGEQGGTLYMFPKSPLAHSIAAEDPEGTCLEIAGLCCSILLATALKEHVDVETLWSHLALRIVDPRSR